MKLIFNIFKTIFVIFLIVFLTFNGVLFVQKEFMNEEVPSVLGVTYLKVISGSMEPTIMTNDIVFVELTSNVKTNDIIVYKEDNYLITHRLISMEGDKYITQGDANNVSEEINELQVVGRVFLNNHTLSIILIFLCKPVVLIALGFIFLILPELLKKNK